jgi:hypothetical protein
MHCYHRAPVCSLINPNLNHNGDQVHYPTYCNLAQSLSHTLHKSLSIFTIYMFPQNPYLVFKQFHLES